jgi:hypothetical protein
MTCNSEQIRLLRRYAQTHTQAIAAAKAGISLSTAKRYLKRGGQSRRRGPVIRSWRTRKDPFAEVWNEVKALLNRDSRLEAQTLMEWLCGRYPDKFNPGQVRSLQRRVKDWRVLEGPERKEIFFPQEIVPARQSQSDYTHCNRLEITIAGEPFPHMLYHFMLPYSRWEFVWICFTESYETLTLGYQKAVRELGAVAPEHRTDNLAAAVPIGQRHVFQKRWQDFLNHYGVGPSANTPRKSNENGSVEKSHDLFKHALDQRLRMRGSRNFDNVEEYQEYLRQIVRERNRHRESRLQEEMKELKPLPVGSWDEAKEHHTTVTGWSTVSFGGAVYSVPSRFIGQRLKVLVYYDKVKVFYGKHLVQEVAKVSPGEKCINYRHLIFHLLRKPGAFRQYQFREELFPRLIFRRAYDLLLSAGSNCSDKEYLKILNQAAIGSETEVAVALQELIDRGTLPTSEAVRQICERDRCVPDVNVSMPDLASYDHLLTTEFKQRSSA